MKDTFNINHDSLSRLGINPKEGVIYLENKLAITINPVHVRALQILKKKPAVQTS
ncbi:MAG: hypothetical protein JWM44_3047 [Bacilli bacterium]|nr:hypothetical protein [Bacilli bacterium]